MGLIARKDEMPANHNNQKKIALINDYTGFGRCSVAVQLPVISQLKVQCCTLPTSILSNHTGFESFTLFDYTPLMEAYIAEWRKLDLQFNGICTGFLGSAEQVRIVQDFIREFGESAQVVVDPVMGDYGRPYATYTPEMCAGMREIVRHADITTPNLTEACILLEEPYADDMSEARISELAQKLTELGPAKVVITGIPRGDTMSNFCCEAGQAPYRITYERTGGDCSGTGDVFSAIIAADAVNGVPFRRSVERGAEFVGKCIEASQRLGIPNTDGVAFEEVLYRLSTQD